LEEAKWIESTADKPNLWLWIGVLVASTVAVAFESEIFVGSWRKLHRGWTAPLFLQVFFLPLVGGAAEYVTAVSVAIKTTWTCPFRSSMGSSLLVALFMAPLLVLGQAIGQPMDLDFNPFEAVAVAIAVTVANLITLDGRSDWLEGTLLLATRRARGGFLLSSSLIDNPGLRRFL